MHDKTGGRLEAARAHRFVRCSNLKQMLTTLHGAHSACAQRMASLIVGASCYGQSAAGAAVIAALFFLFMLVSVGNLVITRFWQSSYHEISFVHSADCLRARCAPRDQLWRLDY